MGQRRRPKHEIREAREMIERQRNDRKASKRINQLVVAPEKHISVDTNELRLALRNRLDVSQREAYDDMCKLMEGVANFDFFDLKRRMRNSFLPFAAGAKNQIYLQRSSKALPSTPALDVKEEDFIADVYEVLRASHYHLLTRQEWEIATSEDFMVSLPVEVKWDYMDDKMLKKLWSSKPELEALRSTLPDEMADRILVFHRGVGSQKLNGLLMDQKLDLLMNYTVFALLDKVKAAFSKKKAVPDAAAASSSTSAPAAPFVEGAPAAAGEPSSSRRSSSSSEAEPTRKLTRNQTERSVIQGDQLIQSTHKYAKMVERKTLARQCPTMLTLLKSFPKNMELQEPTFKDIVVLYRKALPPRVPPKASSQAVSKNKEERMQGILHHRNIYIKVFGETAMADMEVVFPEKKVGIKPFQYVNLMITVITALVTGALTLWKAGDKINMNIVWTVASLILTRLFTVYTSAQTQKQTMQQQISAMLYDKMQDSQEGVVSVIMEEMADQQVKQMLLAYTLLVLKGRPLMIEDLDGACEEFLVRDFNHKIDFQVEDALPRLMRWSLVSQDANGKLEAMPLEEACKTLASAWAVAYKNIGAAADTNTKDLITGAGSSFGKGLDQYRATRKQELAKVAEAEAWAAKSTFAKTRESVQSKAGGLPGALGKALGGKPKEPKEPKEVVSPGASAAGLAPMAPPTPSGVSDGVAPAVANGDGGMAPSARVTGESTGSLDRTASIAESEGRGSSGGKRKGGFLKKLSDKMKH